MNLNTLKYNAYNRTPEGLVSKFLRSQRATCKARSSKEGFTPAYTLEDLRKWCLDQPIFWELFKEWSKAGYPRNLVPSIDRIDPDKGYVFDNLQLMTWQENHEKGRSERMELRTRAVVQLSMCGLVLQKFNSVKEAALHVGKHHMGISDTCNGKQKTCGGYGWQYYES